MGDDPLSGLGLLPIQLSDRATFEPYLRSLGEPLSDYTFSQLFSWSNSLRILWRIVRRHLCVFANGTGDLTLLMPPIGDTGSDAALDEAFELMDAYNVAHQVAGRSRVEYVGDEFLGRFDRTRLQVLPMGTDYVYDVRRMIDLAGGDLASKRQAKNRFQRNYRYRVEAYDPAQHLAPCLGLLSQWKDRQDQEHLAEGSTQAVKRQKETLACELSLRHATELGLRGMVVYAAPAESAADPQLSAFTFGEHLGQDQSSIVIEKTDLAMKGLAQFVFSEFCRQHWANRPLVNVGDDWGLQSLAWTKMSYRPVKLMPKYEIRMAARVMARGGDCELRIADCGLPTAARNSVAIRPASKPDISAAVALERLCFADLSFNRRQLSYLQRRPSAIFLVAEHEGRIVGEGIALVRRHRQSVSGRIYSLAVHPDCRRQRIGQKLLDALLRELNHRGATRVFLEVEKENASAQRLYEHSGFIKIGTLPNYYGAGQEGMHMMKVYLPLTVSATGWGMGL